MPTLVHAGSKCQLSGSDFNILGKQALKAGKSHDFQRLYKESHWELRATFPFIKWSVSFKRNFYFNKLRSDDLVYGENWVTILCRKFDLLSIAMWTGIVYLQSSRPLEPVMPYRSMVEGILFPVLCWVATDQVCRYANQAREPVSLRNWLNRPSSLVEPRLRAGKP